MTSQPTIISSDHTFFVRALRYVFVLLHTKKKLLYNFMPFNAFSDLGNVIFLIWFNCILNAFCLKIKRKIYQRKEIVCTTTIFRRPTPIFRPEMMFSYFTPKLQTFMCI